MLPFGESYEPGGDGSAWQTSGSRPLRVLIVAPSLNRVGGQSVQANILLTGLAKEPLLKVVFLPIDPQLVGPLGQLQRIKYLRTIVRWMLYCAALLRDVRSCDLIHVYSASYFSFLLAPTPAIFVARVTGKKIVLNYHSGEAEDHLRRWGRTAIPTMRLANAIAVPSDYLVDVFARVGLQARAIFNTVDVTRFRFRERRPLRPLFFTNRHLEPLYNVGSVLRAFGLIQQQLPEARLTVAGDGSQRAGLERLAQELKLRNTSFVGQVSPATMPDLYDASDIYLNGSNVDNMPISLLEAFAAGLPVVTTDAGGIPYIVADGETGLLVRCDDHEAMARRAMHLLEDAALAARVSHRAREECRRYTWPSVREQWLSLYCEAADGA